MLKEMPYDPTPAMRLQETYVKSKLLASALLYSHGTSEAG